MKKNQKKKNNKYGIIVVVILIILGMFGIGEYSGIFNEERNLFANSNNSELINETQVDNKNTNDQIPINGDIQIHFFDVGQADSILLISDNKTMLIDAGNNNDGKLVVDDIQKLGISKLDYVIGTHPHEDHIGGLDNVIDSFDIGTIYMPKIQTNTKTFESVLDSISNKNLSITSPDAGSKFMVGNVECEVMLCGSGTEKEQKNNLNLSSIVVRAVYGQQSYLFMGDAEEENEQSRLWPNTNVLKVGHHGSDTSSSQSFLEQVKPEVAIISVGKDNSYGHPKQVTIDKLQKLNTTIYRTDEKGNILIKSDGIKNDISFY